MVLAYPIIENSNSLNLNPNPDPDPNPDPNPNPDPDPNPNPISPLLNGIRALGGDRRGVVGGLFRGAASSSSS